MRCKYCGVEVPQESQFCPNCGKDLSNLRKCVKCGKIIDDDAIFCPHCGAEQPVYEEDNPHRKWVWIISVILILTLVGGYYFMSRKSNKSALLVDSTVVGSIAMDSITPDVAKVTTTIKEDIPVLHGIQDRMVNILIRYVRSDDSQPFTKIGFTHLEKISHNEYSYTNFYGSEGVTLKPEAECYLYGIDSTGYHFGNNPFNGMKKNSLAISDMHCEDFSPTCLVYKNKALTRNLKRQLKTKGFSYNSYFRGWTNDSGQPLVVFGSYDDGTYIMAVGNNLY